jgi:hypothetical protein
MKASIAERIQAALLEENLYGWLFYSFHGSDPIAENILQLDHARLAIWRWFYLVPAVGEPAKLVHAIESEMLDALPGEKKVYLPWQQIRSHLTAVLAGFQRVAVQFSPFNAITCISRVDGLYVFRFNPECT